MSWIPDTWSEQRKLDLRESEMVDFLIWRLSGIPSAAYIACLPDEEADALVTDYVADEHERLWNQYAQLSPASLKIKYDEERARFNNEFAKYRKPLSTTALKEELRADRWTLDEALAFSLGIVPRDSLVTWARRNAHFSPEVGEIARRSRLIERARRAGVLTEFVPPRTFLEWARRKDFEMPAVLLEETRLSRDPDQLEAELGRAREDISNLENKLEDPNRIAFDDVLRMLSAICIARLGLRTEAKRSKLFRELENELRPIMGSVSDKTIRKYIRAGMVLLAKDQQVDIPDEDAEQAAKGS